ncbi:MAG: hypothetical protein ACERKT_06085 [Acidobacteriota bacterium]
MNRSLLAIPLLAVALTLGACSSDDSGDGATETETSAAVTGETGTAGNGQAGGSEGGESSQKQDKSGIKITTSDSSFGTILFDGSDQAIYLFDKENSSTSECYGDCASAWPPVLTKGEPQAAGGAESKLLGTTKRDDGTTQVTYADRPLYYYVDDPPGEVLCHNVVEFGGNWQVVQPDGNPAA